MDTPWTEEGQLREALTRPCREGPLLPLCLSLHAPEPQSLAEVPPPQPLSRRPSGRPLVALSQQWAFTSVVGGEGPLAGQLQGPQRDLHVLTGA